MARVGSLSPKTYWPRPGDMLDDVSEGISWECVRANSHKDDDVSGEKTRYALFLGRHSEFDEPIRLVVHDAEDPAYGQLLQECEVIHRKKGEDIIDYEWNEATDTWRQV